MWVATKALLVDFSVRDLVKLYVNSSPPIVRHICVGKLGQHWMKVMAWRLLGAKPLPSPTPAYYQLDPCEQTSVTFELKKFEIC